MTEAELEGLELYEVMALMADLAAGESISMWPSTWGWGALLVISVLIVLGGWCWRRQTERKLQHRFTAVQAIESLDDHCSILAISAVLKRCALHDFERQQIASLTGQQWQKFLNKHAPSGVKFDDFNALHYGPNSSDIKRIKENAIVWLRGYRVSS
jgi:hypothetical protein